MNEIHATNATMVLSILKWSCDKRILKKSEERKRPFVHHVLGFLTKLSPSNSGLHFGLAARFRQAPRGRLKETTLRLVLSEPNTTPRKIK